MESAGDSPHHSARDPGKQHIDQRGSKTKGKNNNKKNEGSGGAGRSVCGFRPRQHWLADSHLKCPVPSAGAPVPQNRPAPLGSHPPAEGGALLAAAAAAAGRGRHSGQDRGIPAAGRLPQTSSGAEGTFPPSGPAAAHAHAQTLQTPPLASGVPPRDPPAPRAEPPNVRAPRDWAAPPPPAPPAPAPTLPRAAAGPSGRPAGPAPRAPHLGGHGGRLPRPGTAGSSPAPRLSARGGRARAAAAATAGPRRCGGGGSASAPSLGAQAPPLGARRLRPPPAPPVPETPRLRGPRPCRPSLPFTAACAARPAEARPVPSAGPASSPTFRPRPEPPPGPRRRRRRRLLRRAPFVPAPAASREAAGPGSAPRVAARGKTSRGVRIRFGPPAWRTGPTASRRTAP
ncbi:basic proline-rich protein-like [Felis catus]|uniref:basic proline-rich protein-like n=1 Tax=Felis catus TaxID=9685 RepID=UPI001D1A314C|nr:basic proline-rich protein-like [Felis catus]